MGKPVLSDHKTPDDMPMTPAEMVQRLHDEYAEPLRLACEEQGITMVLAMVQYDPLTGGDATICTGAGSRTTRLGLVRFMDEWVADEVAAFAPIEQGRADDEDAL